MMSVLRELDRAGTLARARVVCFATHAIFPGRDDTLAEPGLALAGGELLLASEAAKLRLDADWVLLKACYTGAASGRTITDPLSGLARAFFTAGTRNLLVSHWPVDVHATQALICELFAPDNTAVRTVSPCSGRCGRSASAGRTTHTPGSGRRSRWLVA